MLDSSRFGGDGRVGAATARRGGSNQTQVGIYNERLLLDFVRRHPDSAAVDICRRTGLSAQTVTGIVNRLLAAGLLEKRRRRANGGIGQPAVPLRLRVSGAYAIGVKIGRVSAETMLIDFGGRVLSAQRRAYDYPRAEGVLPWARRRIAAYRAELGDCAVRVAGVGVATFFGFGGWRDVYPMPEAAVRRWERTDLAGELAFDGRQALLVNDATAACIAASELDGGAVGDNFLYVYVGAFVGGGVVVDRQVFFGDNGNAGALASMAVGRGQLMNHASLYLLTRALARAGCALGDGGAKTRDIVARWRRDAAAALATAIVSAVAVLDFRAVVIDGELPKDELEALVTAVRRALTPRRLQGLVRPEVRMGEQGAAAGGLGAAWLPLYVSYSPAQALLLKRLPPVAVPAL